MAEKILSALWTTEAREVWNHLWQSTLFAGIIALITFLLRKHQARTRYWLWVSASAKFILPFSLLISLGSHLTRTHGTAKTQSAAYFVVDTLTQPFSDARGFNAPLTFTVAQPTASHNFLALLPALVAVVWVAGFVAILGFWGVQWRRMSKVVRVARPLREGREFETLRRVERITKVSRQIEILSSQDSMEPGIFGVRRPVLLWPEGISLHLNDAHLEAVLAHEICHVQRRDNLTAVIHMLVEAIFWFHPLVWWMESQLVKERELACDEDVLRLCSRRQAYAESILKVCEFCIKSPQPFVSGITGADLKKRVAQIMTGTAAFKLSLTGRSLLAAAAVIVLALPVVRGQVIGTKETAAPPSSRNPKEIAGNWQGTLETAGKGLRIVLKVTKEDGQLKAVMYSIDQTPQPIPISSIVLQGSAVSYSIKSLNLTYTGTLSADGNSISGSQAQGGHPYPLNFQRVSEENTWAIPKSLQPMPANAFPKFEVATIKPSDPTRSGRLFTVKGRHVMTINTDVNDLISFAYGVHPKQIVGGPMWFGTDKFDIDGTPDVEGQPSQKQLQTLLQTLLADRFKVVFHHEKRELSVYAITVATNGPKLAKTIRKPGDPTDFLFARPGALTVNNATMQDFANGMQRAVMDKPVVDHTGLTDRYDFVLNWTADETQFLQMGMKVKPPSIEDASALPDLYDAIQQQLGLKLESTKGATDVVVIDHAEKPSAN